MSARTAGVRLRLERPLAWPFVPVAERLCEIVAHSLSKPPREVDVVRLLAEAPQAVPRLPCADEDRLPRFAAASLALHALLVLTALWHWRATPPTPPREIPVELVQAPEAKPKPAQAETKPKPADPAKKQDTHQKPQPRRSARAAHRPPPPAPRAAEKPISMPVRALPGTADADPNAEAVAYPQLVLSKLAKAKKEGRYVGVPGYAGVRFRIADDGSLESVKLASSSGDPSLDIEAVAMIKRAAPYPPPPPGGRRDYGITLLFEARP